MAVFTLRLLRIYRRMSDSAKYIFTIANRLKMIRIDTIANPTQMIEGQIIRYWPHSHLIEPAMRTVRPKTDPEMRITFSRQMTRPEPTRFRERSIEHDSIERSFNQPFGCHSHYSDSNCLSSAIIARL